MVQPRVLIANGRRMVPVVSQIPWKMTSTPTGPPPNVMTLISTPIPSEVSAALKGRSPDEGPYYVFDEADMLSTPKSLTLLTNVVSHLASCTTPCDIVHMYTSESAVLSQFLAFISSSSQHCVTHVVIPSGANTEEYELALGSLPRSSEEWNKFRQDTSVASSTLRGKDRTGQKKSGQSDAKPKASPKTKHKSNQHHQVHPQLKFHKLFSFFQTSSWC